MLSDNNRIITFKQTIGRLSFDNISSKKSKTKNQDYERCAEKKKKRKIHIVLTPVVSKRKVKNCVIIEDSCI